MISARARAEPLQGGPVELGLLGSWSATRWQYRSRSRPNDVVDVVCTLGATVTLSLSEELYVLTWSSVNQSSRSLAGAFSIHGDRLELQEHERERPEAVWFRLAGETLALSSDASEWDFDGDGRGEAADFVAVLVRL